MNLSRIWRSRSLAGGVSALALGGLAAAVGALGVVLPALGHLEERVGLHWLYGARGALAAPSAVVVVAIDEQSARDLGLPELPRTWPRRLHAELVRHLVDAGARAIAFDLTFDTPSVEPSDDAEFAAAIRAAGNVLLAEAIRREELVLPGHAAGLVGRAVIERPSPPIAPLRQAALGSAPFLLPKDAEVNSYWTFRDDAGRTPTLPVLALRVHARDAVREFGARLQRIDADLAAAWSASAAASSGEASLRDLLRSSAGTRTRLAAGLGEAGASGLPRSASAWCAACWTSTRPRRSATSTSTVRRARSRPCRSRWSSNGLDRRRRASAANAATFRDRAVFIGYAAATPDGQDRLRDDYRTVSRMPAA